MAKRREPAISGVLVVDKPQGVTSHDVVAAVRSALHMKRVGHAGTLDPMATGALVVGFGNATRLLPYIVDHRKTYEATIRFGQATDTDDADGAVIAPPQESAALPDTEALRAMIAERFTGQIMQVPNAFSAIKVNGQRAYDLAREGKDVELEARPVTITRFNAGDVRPGTAADGTPVADVDVVVECSAGTYIRALARDLGAAFGCGAHLTRLRRLAVGAFSVQEGPVTAHAESRTFTNRDGETVTRQRAVLDAGAENLLAHAYSMAQAARRTMPVVGVTAAQASDLRYGRFVKLPVKQISAAILDNGNAGDVVAIVAPAHGKAKPTVVFPAQENAAE